MMRVGLGYDSHRFDPSRPLVLGGLSIPGHPGLSGHSDGDAVAHAVIDAILGGASAGDVGLHFPPDDDRWEGADSMDLLRRAAAIVEEKGLGVVNVDLVVVAESPKIGPLAPAMVRALAGALGIPETHVSVKGKSNERMGWIGAGEGLAVHAVALMAELDAGEP